MEREGNSKPHNKRMQLNGTEGVQEIRGEG